MSSDEFNNHFDNISLDLDQVRSNLKNYFNNSPQQQDFSEDLLADVMFFSNFISVVHEFNVFIAFFGRCPSPRITVSIAIPYIGDTSNDTIWKL